MIAVSDCEITFDWNGGMPVAELAWGRRAYVRADISVEGTEAELLDIRHLRPPRSYLAGVLRIGNPDHRGKGLGTILLRQLCDELQARGVRVLKANPVGEDMERLRRWYRREGFLWDEMSGEMRKILVPIICS